MFGVLLIYLSLWRAPHCTPLAPEKCDLSLCAAIGKQNQPEVRPVRESEYRSSREGTGMLIADTRAAWPAHFLFPFACKWRRARAPKKKGACSSPLALACLSCEPGLRLLGSSLAGQCPSHGLLPPFCWHIRSLDCGHERTNPLTLVEISSPVLMLFFDNRL